MPEQEPPNRKKYLIPVPRAGPSVPGFPPLNCSLSPVYPQPAVSTPLVIIRHNVELGKKLADSGIDPTAALIHTPGGKGRQVDLPL